MPELLEESMLIAHQLYPNDGYPNGYKNLASAMTNLGADHSMSDRRRLIYANQIIVR